jgi:RNA polymerase sigma-70 factor, ECF subfamily
VKHHQPALAGDALDKVALTTMLDEVLIAMVAAHDRNAMHVLFVRHSARTYRFLLRLIGDATTAEDLLSEVFIEVWRSAGRFESRSKLSTWILAIARHKAASARRRRCCDQLDDNAEQLPEDRLDDPEAAAHKNGRDAILRDCLQRLSPAHREVLDLIYYQAQSVAEVARIIGVPQNTVKTRAYYARKQIAQLMVARGIDRGAL